MGEKTTIAWTDHSWSPWLGCTKVSAGCDNCYAEALVDKRHHWAGWGPGNPRKRTSTAYWRDPIKWNNRAATSGVREKVFPSLCDPFDREVSDVLRIEFFDLVARTPALDWIIVGGESGRDSRPFEVSWARETIAQCKSAGVACFVKQLGAHPCEASTGNGQHYHHAHGALLCHKLNDQKGGDPAEWPEDLRVQEFPQRRRAL